MCTNTDPILQKLAAISLEKCLLRLSGGSEGAWQVVGIEVSPGTLPETIRQRGPQRPALAVHFDLNVDSVLTMLMLFDHEDIECISKAFTGHSFPKGERTTPAEEIMLLELGNIVLNALASSVLNVLNKFSIPAVPQFIEGDTDRILKGVGAAASPETQCSVVKVTLAIRYARSETISEIFAFIPDETALKISQAAAAGKMVSH